MEDVVVIGGGLAGLSLGCNLSENDVEVKILEKEDYLGGRASNTVHDETGSPVPIGPHVFLEGYSNLLDFFERIGSDDNICWSGKVSLDLIVYGRHEQVGNNDMTTKSYKAPFRGNFSDMGFTEILKTVWFFVKSRFVSRQRIEELDDRTVKEYLVEENRLPEKIVERYVEFFVESLLNTPIDECSAGEFMNLLNAWFDTDKRRFGFADGGLGDIYTGNARNFIEERGGEVSTCIEVEKLVFEDGEVTEIVLEDEALETENKKVVSTLPRTQLREIIPEDRLEEDFFSSLKDFEALPYKCVFNWFDTKVTEEEFWAIKEEEGGKLNTDFYDKSNLDGFERENSYIASNIINSTDMEDMDDDEIIEKTVEEISLAFPEKDLQPTHSRVNHVPYAIYRPITGMRRKKLPHETPFDNLFIAGDWTIREAPQCMEAAVRSGYRCSEKVLESLGKEKQYYIREFR